jgi:hypothetical protein
VFGSEILIEGQAAAYRRGKHFLETAYHHLADRSFAAAHRKWIRKGKISKVVENAISGKTILQRSELPADFLSDAHQAALVDSIKRVDERIEEVKTAILDHMSRHWTDIVRATQQNRFAQRNMGHLLDDPEKMLAAIVKARKQAYVQNIYGEILKEYDKIALVEAEKTLHLKRLLSDLYNFAVKLVSVGIEKSNNKKTSWALMI